MALIDNVLRDLATTFFERGNSNSSKTFDKRLNSYVAIHGLLVSHHKSSFDKSQW